MLAEREDAARVPAVLVEVHPAIADRARAQPPGATPVWNRGRLFTCRR